MRIQKISSFGRRCLLLFGDGWCGRGTRLGSGRSIGLFGGFCRGRLYHTHTISTHVLVVVEDVGAVVLLVACMFMFMLTCGGYEAVEVSHRGVVDERVGDHGCGVLLTIRVGVDGGIL